MQNVALELRIYFHSGHSTWFDDWACTDSIYQTFWRVTRDNLTTSMRMQELWEPDISDRFEIHVPAKPKQPNSVLSKAIKPVILIGLIALIGVALRMCKSPSPDDRTVPKFRPLPS